MNTDYKTLTQAESSTPAQRMETKPAVRPRYSVSEQEQSYTLRAVMPGVAKKDAQIHVENDTLTLTGHRAETAHADTVRYLHREISTADFRLQLTIGSDVDTTAVSATADSGILTVTLPKKESAKPRKITIS